LTTDSNKYKLLKTIGRFLIPLILLFFVGRYIYHDRERISLILSDVKPGWMIASFLFYFTGVGCIGFNWKKLMNLLGAECSYDTAFRSYYYSMLAKYIPGRIWGATGRVVLNRKEAIPEGTTILGIILESFLLMISASLTGLFAIGSYGKLPLEVRCLAAGSPLILILLHPVILNKAIGFMAGKFPKFIIKPENLPGFRSMVSFSIRFCLIWLLQGLGFWCALNSLTHLSITSIMPVIGGNALAWLAGFVVVLTPAGLGVREFILTRINTGCVGAGPAALAAFMGRIFVISSELVGALIMFLIQIKGKTE